MERFYWYVIESMCNFKSLSDSIKNARYDDSKEQGFTVNSISKNCISGKYVKSKIVTQKFVNPFGDDSFEQRKIYEIINFEISKENAILLQMRNPDRCVSSFLTELNKVTNYSLFIDRPKFILPDLLIDLRNKGLVIIQVKEMELSEIALSREAVGTLTIKGNLSIDDYEKKLLIADLKHKLKKFKAIVDFNGIRETIEVHSSNKIIMSGKLAKLINPIFKHNLQILD